MEADRATRPFLAVYVVWHPSSPSGPELFDALYKHFRRDLFTNVAGGAGINVIGRFAAPPGGTAPLEIDLDDADATAVVVLADEAMAGSPDHRRYVRSLRSDAEALGLTALVFPVSLDGHAFDMGEELGTDQALRWDLWIDLGDRARQRRLIAELTHQFCRMLRHCLAALEHPGLREDALDGYLQPVRMFLSHSKHDAFGSLIAQAVRSTLQASGDLATFFDVLNIPPGLAFDKVLLHFVRVSAMLVVHTDSYGSRSWCRREVLEAKRHDVPIVVANCISDFEERGFPYMGNVPVIRMEPADPPDPDRMATVVARLLDEVLKDYLWKCRTRVARSRDTAATFLPRQPELVSLVSAAAGKPEGATRLFVYPDPPLGAEETALFESVSSGILLQSFTEWLAEAPP